jgi:hypothetical protein
MLKLGVVVVVPRELGLKFSTWSLRVLAGYVMEKKIVGSIIIALLASL